MKDLSRTLFLLTAVFLIFVGKAAAQNASARRANASTLSSLQGTPISRVSIVGNKRIDEDTIRLQIESQPSTGFDSTVVSEDIKNIYLSGFFEEVSAQIQRKRSSLVLIFVVKEKAGINTIEISGADNVSESTVRKKLDLEDQRFVDSRRFSLAVKELAAYYQSEGYYGTEIDYSVEPFSDEQVNVLIDITEGKKKKIEKVAFEGNKDFNTDALREVVGTRPYTWYSSWLTGSGVVKQDALETDVQLLTQHYLKNGYADVRVSQAEVVEDTEGLKVVFKISEGDQFSYGAITVQGEILEAGEEATLEGIDSKEGETFNVEFLREDTFKISEKFTDIGYAFANVEPLTSFRRDDKKIDVAFRVNRGKLIYINQVIITGNQKTYDNVIRRSLNVDEGELYSSSKIKRSQALVKRLGYFDEVTIVSEPTDVDTEVDLNVGVREGQTGTFSIGAGVSSGDGFLVSGRVSENNLFGTGNSLTLDINAGTRRDNIVLSFNNPRVNDTRWSFGADLLNVGREFNDFDRSQAGGTLTVGYPLWFLGEDYLDDIRFSLGYELTRIEIDNLSPNASDLIVDQQGKSVSSSVIPRLVRNTIDNPLDPTKGSRQVLRLELAGLGGDEKFWLAQFNNTWYYPFYEASFGDFVFSQRTRFGWGETYDGDSFPLFRRFFPGGINSVRGFEPRELGPKDAQGSEFGGSKQLVGNFEVIFPLVSSMGLRGVAFYDIGNAFDDDESIEFSQLRHAVGWGVRWRSPIAPIRIEIGYPLNREEGERSVVTNFSFGSPL